MFGPHPYRWQWAWSWAALQESLRARTLNLSDEEAQWLERVMADRGWLRVASMPDEVSAHLIDRKLLRAIGADVFITPAGIDALVYYRNERSPSDLRYGI